MPGSHDPDHPIAFERPPSSTPTSHRSGDRSQTRCVFVQHGVFYQCRLNVFVQVRIELYSTAPVCYTGAVITIATNYPFLGPGHGCAFSSTGRTHPKRHWRPITDLNHPRTPLCVPDFEGMPEVYQLGMSRCLNSEKPDRSAEVFFRALCVMCAEPFLYFNFVADTVTVYSSMYGPQHGHGCRFRNTIHGKRQSYRACYPAHGSRLPLGSLGTTACDRESYIWISNH